MDASQMLGYLKLPQKTLWGLVLVAALMLWGPVWFIDGLGLADFISEYRKYLGVTFLILLAAALPQLLSMIFGALKKRYREWQWRKHSEKRLHDLTPEEKTVLSYYIVNETRTQILDLVDGVTSALQDERIIYRAANVSHGRTRFSYNIQPWAWDYLQANPELLK